MPAITATNSATSTTSVATTTTTPIDTHARLLVTGASGHLGQRIVSHLLDSLHIAPSHIVATSRDPSKLSAFAARGVVTRRLDFDDAASVADAARGVDRALLISGNDMFNRVAGHKTAVRALVEAGVRHILYTSLANVDNTLAFVKSDHVATEQFIRDTTAATSSTTSTTTTTTTYTFLRNGLYFENDLGAIAGAKHSGKWYSAARDGQLAALSRDDVALANATALASAKYENQIYELTGAKGLTVDQIAANVREALHKGKVEVVQVSEDALAKGISAATGWPIELARALATFDTNTAAGLAGPHPRGDFKTLTGRDPLSHHAWLESMGEVLAAL